VDLTPEILAKFERLIAVRIQLLPTVEVAKHFVFERDGYIALVERRDAGFGGIGAAGMLADGGFAALVHRDDGAFFVGKGFEKLATDEQVQGVRAFQADLERALSAVGRNGN
jgi:hypothetical protein